MSDQLPAFITSMNLNEGGQEVARVSVEIVIPRHITEKAKSGRLYDKIRKGLQKTLADIARKENKNGKN